MSEINSMELIHWGDCSSRQPVNRMGEILSQKIKESSQVDILTGYFCFNGTGAIADALQAKLARKEPFKMRILVGMDVKSTKGEGFTQQINECEIHERLTNEARQERYKEFLDGVFRNLPDKDKNHNDRAVFNAYVKMLELNDPVSLEIRQTQESNHSKLYLFYKGNEPEPDSYVLGSSNFSKQGLFMRHELNINVHHEGAETLRRLFDQLWDQSSCQLAVSRPSSTSKKSGVLQNSTNAVTDDTLKKISPHQMPTPFEAYMGIMRYVVAQKQPRPELLNYMRDVVVNAGYKPLNFQLIGAANAISILQTYGGVIIADGVGLGKSITASLVARCSQKTGGGVIIAPPPLVKGWRDKYLVPFALDKAAWEVFSMTQLEEALKYSRDHTVSTIIVDEAHRFRNSHLDEYETLEELCRGKSVVLLTATPFNNAPSDLESLFRLFPSQEHCLEAVEILKDDGSQQMEEALQYINAQQIEFKDLVFLQRNWYRTDRPRTVESDFQNLRGNYPDITDPKQISHNLKVLGEKLQEQFARYVVRRNRADLDSDCYWDDGKPIAYPKQTTEGIYYTLTKEQENAYKQIIGIFRNNPETKNEAQRCKCFTASIYRAGEYANTDGDNGNYAENYRMMAMRRLIQRFESSPASLQSSILSLIKRHNEAIKSMGKGYFDPKGLDLNDEDDEPDIVRRKVKKGRVYVASATDRQQREGIEYVPFTENQFNEFNKHLQQDLNVLEDLENATAILCRDDPKVAKLIELIKPAVMQSPGQRDPFLPAGSKSSHMPSKELTNGAPRRVVIFTMFIDTAVDLARTLSNAFGGELVMLAVEESAMQGDKGDIGRSQFVSEAGEIETYFDTQSTNDKPWEGARVLITTDKFSEGINLNRAGILVNYDIPWNPVRVIQRIGRINRISACWFDDIFVFNLYPSYAAEGAERPYEHASAQDIAKSKMILIHELFLEDDTIFGNKDAEGEKPYEKHQQAVQKILNTKSLDTIIYDRYMEALKKVARTKTERDAFEQKLSRFGTGMRTVKLKAKDGNMLFFKQTPTMLRCEVLGHLPPENDDERPRQISIIEALNLIKSDPTDPFIGGDNPFPKYYEDIKEQMRMPKSGTDSSFGENKKGRSKKFRDAQKRMEEWQKRDDLSLKQIELIGAILKQQHLPNKFIVEVINTEKEATKDSILSVIDSACRQGLIISSNTSIPILNKSTEIILTFVNENMERTHANT